MSEHASEDTEPRDDDRMAEALPNAIKKRRLDQGLTREQLAAKAECDTRTIRKAEAGQPILRSKMRDIAEALGTHFSYLVDGDATTKDDKINISIVIEGNIKVQEHIREIRALILLIMKVLNLSSKDIEMKGIFEGSALVEFRLIETAMPTFATMVTDFYYQLVGRLLDTPGGQVIAMEVAQGDDVNAANLRIIKIIENVSSIQILNTEEYRKSYHQKFGLNLITDSNEVILLRKV